MKDPPRLLDTGDDFTRELLGSVRDDDKSHKRAMGRTAVALGLPATLSAAAAGTATGTAAASTAASVSVIAKWFSVGAIVAGSTMATVEWVGGAADNARATPPNTAQVDLPKPVEPKRAPSMMTSRLADAAVSPLESVPKAARTVPVGKAASPPNEGDEMVEAEEPLPSKPSSLSNEVAALDEAAAALQRGDPERALRVVGEYETPSRTGVLDPEALRVKVEALNRMGRVREAAHWASVFVARFPTSPHAGRMRELAEKSAPPMPSR